jgi:hypothetical protein
MTPLINTALSNNQPANFLLNNCPFQTLYLICYYKICRTQTCFLLLRLKTNVVDMDLINKTWRLPAIADDLGRQAGWTSGCGGDTLNNAINVK